MSISKILHKYFSSEAIRYFAICGKQEDIVYQVSHGFKREMRRNNLQIGYEITEMGKMQIIKDNKEVERLNISIDELGKEITAFFKEEKKYWKEHPQYIKKEEYKHMNEDEEYAYKYLQTKLI